MPAFVTVLMFAFVAYCALDVLFSDPGRVRTLPKLVWLLLVLLLPPLGALAWLVAGRPAFGGAAPGGGSVNAPPAHQRGPRGEHPAGRRRPSATPPPRGPDDDPEFLRRIEERLRRPPEQGRPDEDR